MEIITYVNKSPNNYLNKVLEQIETLEGTLRNQIDVINPIVTLASWDFIANYLFIPILNRYYFVNDIVIKNTNYYEVHLKIDVLNTYKDTILKSTGKIRNSEYYVPYYSGLNLPIDVRENVTKLEFNNPFNEDGTYVFCVTSNGVNT